MLLETKTELDNLNVSQLLLRHKELLPTASDQVLLALQMEKGFLETALTHYQSKLDAAVAARKARTASDSDQEMENF